MASILISFVAISGDGSPQPKADSPPGRGAATQPKPATQTRSVRCSSLIWGFDVKEHAKGLCCLEFHCGSIGDIHKLQIPLYCREL